MNTTLQKRIEEASIDYTIRTKPICIAGDAFADMARELNKNPIFIAGANYALQNQWISVDKALPEENKLGDSDFVFVKTSIRFPFLACYSYKHKTWKDINHVAIHGVTHWMLIPELEGGE